MALIDKYNLQASVQFPVSGTEELTENFNLVLSTTSQEGVISGTVTSGGSPVEGAVVKVFDSFDNPIAHVITNPQGKYTIPAVVSGSYKVTAAKDGYLTPQVISVTVVANRPTTVDISLDAVPGATVKLFGRGFVPLHHTETDRSGNFSFLNTIPPENYEIIASAKGYKVSESLIISLIPHWPLYITIRLYFFGDIALLDA